MNTTPALISDQNSFVQTAKLPIIYSSWVAMILVVVTNILNICVLSRRTLRTSSCTCYLLASVPPVFLYVVVSPLSIILNYSDGIHINGTPITCKLSQYVIFTTSLLYVLMLVCATIDRYCASSSSVRLRQLAQVRIARRIIIIAWILTLIYMGPTMIAYYYDANNANCTSYSTILSLMYLMSRFILYYILVPIILSLFGTLTIYNIRNQTQRIAPTVNVHRRTESQMARLLIIQVAMYFLFCIPLSVTYILATFIPSMNTPYFTTIRVLTIIWQQGGYFISFFLFVLTGKIYRDELKKMFRWDQIRRDDR